MERADFAGRRVVSFESRRAPEMASLIERHGGVPVSAPALREVAVPIGDDAAQFARALANGGIDVLLLLTGVGTRALATAAREALPDGGFERALARTQIVARGPKPAAALRELGVTDYVSVPEPNTWREAVETLASLGPIAGKRVSIQEYGAPNAELYAALRERGADVQPIPVYRYALPEDTAPLRAALQAIARGEIPIALFTSRAQVEHAALVATEQGIVGEVKRALARGVVASIGPVCSDALRLEGITPDVEPAHGKMGHLVKDAAARSGAVLDQKQRA